MVELALVKADKHLILSLYLNFSEVFGRSKEQKPRINSFIRQFQVGIGDVPVSCSQVKVGARIADRLFEAERSEVI